MARPAARSFERRPPGVYATASGTTLEWRHAICLCWRDGERHDDQQWWVSIRLWGGKWDNCPQWRF